MVDFNNNMVPNLVVLIDLSDVRGYTDSQQALYFVIVLNLD